MAQIEINIQIDEELEDIPWDSLADMTFKVSKQEKNSEKEISLCICSEAEIKKLNAQYRSKDYVTDVLSFEPASIEGIDLPILGDIVICLKRAKEQAIEYKHSLKYELSYLFVHGLLHLLGYDHEEDEEEARIMFELQDRVLENFCL